MVKRYSAAMPRTERRIPERDGQQDRDRILYSSAFRRLAGITQVVSAAEGQVFHNRLTHSLKVAHIGRSLAEHLTKMHRGDVLLRMLGPIEPDVVEAACLAHDLGHPPFGHVAEKALCDCLLAHGVCDGFEGNAQSFRIVTQLSAYRAKYHGLNLTRATLDALLKYPWLRNTRDDARAARDAIKWGAYDSERDTLEWVRGAVVPYGLPGSERHLEAEIMDWADDVAYAYHDLEDFYRSGFVPLHMLREEGAEQNRFLRKTLPRIREKGSTEGYSDDELREAFKELASRFPVDSAYQGTHVQRAGLRLFTQERTAECVQAVVLADPGAGGEPRPIRIDRRRRVEVSLLKELTWYYVINNPALATQQDGQRRVIRALFDIHKEAMDAENWFMFPEGYRDLLLTAPSQEGRLRVIADYIASMHEAPAVKLHQRLTGSALGSVSDHVLTP